MSSQQPVLVRLINLRFLVGALGERLRWWSSQFTGEIGLRQLERLFPRTHLRAAVESVSLAARRDHDDQLHPDAVHLFRLGSAQEDAIAHHLAMGTARLQPPPATADEILAALEALGQPVAGSPPIGPCSLGKSIRTAQHAGVADLARAYAAAARAGHRAVPYFETD